jgi:hypothetical protein
MGPIFKFIGVALIAAAGLFATVGTSSAMPVAPTQQRTESGLLQDVRWGCGPGWAPNRWGRCVPIRRYYAPRYYYGGPRYYYGRPRYYGYHRPWGYYHRPYRYGPRWHHW